MFQTAFLNPAGAVFVMGSNNQGQLGNGESGPKAYSSAPVRVELPGPMGEVGSGMGTTWAISTDGRHAYAWGSNKRGQLGIGDSGVAQTTTPLEMAFHLPKNATITQLADGLKQGMVLLSNGQVLAWGDNEYGQGGHYPEKAGPYLYAPVKVRGISDVKQLASGHYFSMALKNDGTVWAWGQNYNGEIGPGGRNPGHKAAHDVAPVEVTGLPPIKFIVAGGRDAIAVDQSGNVWEWGRNEFGEVGNGTVDLADGPHPIPQMVKGLPPIVSIDSEGPTVLAADAQGNIYAWGFNKWGAVGDGDTINTGVPQKVLTIPTSPDTNGPSVQVAAAHRSVYAFNVVTGQTYAWGQNNYGQIGEPANTVANPHPVDITALVAPALSAPLYSGIDTTISSGSTGQTITGTPQDDHIIDHGSHNVIVGGAGNDTIVAASHDKVDGGSGDDTIHVTGHHTSVDGGSGADLLVDHGRSNRLSGGDGNDTLVSQGKADTSMTGGSGNDLFFVDGSRQPASSGVPQHVATVTDFLSGVDHLSFGSVAGSDGGLDTLSAPGVQSLAQALHAAASAASQADYMFVAGGSDGYLLYAPNGDGHFSAAITLTGHHSASSLHAADIVATHGLNKI